MKYNNKLTNFSNAQSFKIIKINYKGQKKTKYIEIVGLWRSHFWRNNNCGTVIL